jgi:FAD/FMN-containing dehydrogenase
MTRVDPHGSWGRVFRPIQSVVRATDRTLRLPDGAVTVLPYGCGRSYGDSCLNDGGAIIQGRDLDRFIGFDAESGLLRCEAGVTLEEINDLFLPRGWFLPVTPGTKFVTVGGALANDVHGKNHHRAGTFGHHVPRFGLSRSDGSHRECSPEKEPALFRATIGGLGLTGLVTWVELNLRRVGGPWISQRAIRFRSLGEFFDLCDPLEREQEHLVAWLDCSRGGIRGARGVFFAGNHDPTPGPVRCGTRVTFPFDPPVSLVGRTTVRVFNALYYAMHGGMERPRPVPIEKFFYPLDSVLDWNRIYGSRGFLQYQCVVPEVEQGRAALAELLDRIAISGEGSFLAVLKRFGDQPCVGQMSFPMAGFTLALDFPHRGASTLALLESLDGVVASVGGRCYPAKDARMSPASFRSFYPQWREFARHVDPRFSSAFWRRVTGGDEPGGAAA